MVEEAPLYMLYGTVAAQVYVCGSTLLGLPGCVPPHGECPLQQSAPSERPVATVSSFVVTRVGGTSRVARSRSVFFSSSLCYPSSSLALLCDLLRP